MPAGLFVTLAIVLVVLAGVFAAAETALARVGRSDAARLVGEGRRGSAPLAVLVEGGASSLNVAIFLRVTCEAAAAVCVALAVDAFVQRWWAVLLVATAVMAAASYVVVGVSPRTIARQQPEQVALAVAPTLRAGVRLLGPVARLLVVVGNVVTPGRGFRHGPFASEDELRDLVDLASESDAIEAEERRMIHSVFELGDTIVREVMVPRTDMVTVEQATGLEDAMHLFLRSGFSRIPVIGESTDDPLGVLYLKDVARRLHSGHPENDEMAVERAMRPAVFVPESKTVDSLLREMQGDAAHVALVVDEYGGIAGLVTIEDLVEEIVGEIADEYDRDPPQVEALEEGTYRLSARLPIDDLAELFDVEIDEDEVDSVGGLLAKAIGRVPIPGATTTVHGVVLTAERTEGRRNRITSVLAHREAPETLHDDAPGGD
ncbi:hemolysin family protein [Angustibacter speluncae]